jgi:serine protease Do
MKGFVLPVCLLVIAACSPGGEMAMMSTRHGTPPVIKANAVMPTDVSTREKPATEVFKQVAPSVYMVKSEQADNHNRYDAQGSAVAVSHKVAITNCHVILPDGKVYLSKTHDAEKHQAKVVWTDNATDRCFVKVSGTRLQPVKGIRTADNLQIGEKVYAVGNPTVARLTWSLTVTDGIVSGKREDEPTGIKHIQHTAPISNGNSGGGLFDAAGNLIGINFMSVVAMSSQNLNFAIAAEDYWKQDDDEKVRALARASENWQGELLGAELYGL